MDFSKLLMREGKKGLEPLQLTEYITQVGVPLTKEEAFFIRKNYGNYLHIVPSFQKDGLYDITPQHYVGHFVLPTGRTFILSPKFNLSNLFYLLTYAYQLVDFKPDMAWYEKSLNPLEFLVKIFVEATGDLIRKGLYKVYLVGEENHRFIRGKILFPAHLKENQWRKDRIYCQFAEATPDVLENQILKFTTLLLSTQTYHLGNLGERLQLNYRHLDEVSWVSIHPGDLSRVVYNRLNQHYRTALSLCELFLQNISIQSYPGEVKFFSFLLDMNQIFERFISEVLKEKLIAYPSLSLSYQESRWLDRKATRSFSPDLILYKKDKPVLVLDTKYKMIEGGPDSEGLYQILVYCHSLGVKTGILLYPTPVDWHMESWEGVTIWAWGIDVQKSPLCLENHLQGVIKRVLAIIRNLQDS